MRKLLYIIIVILCACSILYADEIYLKDSNIIKCEIIRITDKYIEYYSQEKGGRPFFTIEKDLVSKVIYENGLVLETAGSNKYDKIFIKDGNIVVGKILQITPDVIIYSPGDSDKKEAIVRENILKIIYSNGKEINISEAEINQGKLPASEEETDIQSGGFKDSIIRLSLTGGIGFLNRGDLADKENDLLNQYKEQAIEYSNHSSNNTYINYEAYHGGFELALMLPALEFVQKRRFGLTGIKFGITGSYIFSINMQKINDSHIDDIDFSGRLLKYRTINAGPEMNMIFSPKSNYVNMIFRFYLMGGYIHQGELKALPGLRDAGMLLSEDEYKTGFTGYSATAGTGICFVSNLAFPVITGINIQYTYSKLNFDRALPVYDGAESTSFNDIIFLISAGVHF
jgi:hypothetical protein